MQAGEQQQLDSSGHTLAHLTASSVMTQVVVHWRFTASISGAAGQLMHMPEAALLCSARYSVYLCTGRAIGSKLSSRNTTQRKQLSGAIPVVAAGGAAAAAA